MPEALIHASTFNIPQSDIRFKSLPPYLAPTHTALYVQFLSAPATVEVINTQNGFNAGVQHTNIGLPSYQTSNITLNPGPCKIRMNVTVFAPAPYPGTSSLQSEQFSVVADDTETPTCPDNSGSGLGSASSAGISGVAPTPTQTNPIAGGGTGSGVASTQVGSSGQLSAAWVEPHGRFGAVGARIAWVPNLLSAVVCRIAL